MCTSLAGAFHRLTVEIEKELDKVDIYKSSFRNETVRTETTSSCFAPCFSRPSFRVTLVSSGSKSNQARPITLTLLVLQPPK